MDKFLLTREEFATYRTQFLQRAHTKTLTAIDIVVYNIIRGKHPRNGFTAITTPNKLNCCGLDKWNAFLLAKRSILRSVTTTRSIITRIPRVDLAERFCSTMALPFTTEFLNAFREELINHAD